ncbi:HNH endonuclease [Winogradskyella wandonensis]|nr:HNH endonuclease [Winogradskyella wandonensis]
MKKTFDSYTKAKVLKAFLKDSLSHRQIEKDILDIPYLARGGGFVAMEILHSYNIKKEKKGILKNKSIDELYEIKDKKFNRGLDLLIELDSSYEESEKYFNSFSEIDNNIITDRISQVKARVFQDKLRRIVLSNYYCKCAFCEIDKEDLLICSHIKPWAISIEDRLKATNAICLCVLHDKLFDKGYFGLDSSYNIVFSKKADLTIKRILEPLKFRKPIRSQPSLEFLNYHLKEICLIE